MTSTDTDTTADFATAGLGRDIVLQRIRAGLSHAGAHFISVPEQPAHPVWPVEHPPADTMAERFELELKAVQGVTIRCPTMDEARQQLDSLRQSESWSSFAAVESPLVKDLTSSLPAGTVQWLGEDCGPRQIEPLSASIIPVAALLADTGSCVAFCPTAVERLLCYLPPACVVIAHKEQLYEHLPAAWPTITRTCNDKNVGGEIVIITGPSRTADIEKILILGVHGPKRLIVLLVG